MRSWLLAIAVLLVGVGSAPVAAQEAPTAPFVVPGHFVAAADRHDQALRDFDGHEQILGLAIVERQVAGDPEMQARALSRELGLTVTPMVLYQFAGDPAGEPEFAEQWSLDNRGQTGGTPGADIDVSPTWAWTRGAGVVIAIVDSGIDRTHPDLAARMWRNTDESPANGVDDDNNGYVDDVDGWDFGSDDNDPTDDAGHGTSVASVAVAAANDIGMAGVAPAARAMAVRACDAFGCPASAVADAIVYAVDNGADIVNLSLGAPGEDPLVAAAVEYAAARDVLVISAAGNAAEELDADNPWTPASIDSPNLVAVASSDQTDRLSNSSNYGPAVVDLAAPGTQILTAIATDGYEVRSGTSFSAPHVSGVAALMLTMDRELSAPETAGLIRATAQPLGALAGATISGGRLDAHAAVQAARFRDILSSEFADDAMWAAAGGITLGCGDQVFCPDGVVTRGQMAAFLRRALDLPDGTSDAFTDDDGSEFESDIDAIAAAGITTGCADRIFCLEQPVTRGQMAALLRRALDLRASSTANTFTDDERSVFEGDIEAVAAAGITRGCNPPGNTHFCPEAVITRGQMVAFLNRALGWKQASETATIG
jgi:hypothetical protein